MIWTAFVVGLMGSLHCVGMCGPLALAIPLNDQNRFIGVVFYNSGRTLTYSIIGGLFGVLGAGINLIGFQSYLSTLSGSFIVLIAIFPKMISLFDANSGNQFNQRVRGFIVHQFKRKGLLASFTVGLLNGLLPCGLIYVAVAAALETGYVESAMLYMALFGLGTSVLMIVTMYSKSLINRIKVINPKKLTFYFAIALGTLLITRGILFQLPKSYDQNEIISIMKTITFCHER